MTNAGTWEAFYHRGYAICPAVNGAYAMSNSEIWFEGLDRADVCKQIDEALAEA